MKYSAVIAFAFLSSSALAETPNDLWRDGYKITWESDYEDVEECTPSSGIVLSDGNIFICDGYEYVYHYGAVFIASRTSSFNGRAITTDFLCLVDEDECLSGTLVKR
jgi:hypothetical protein